MEDCVEASITSQYKKHKVVFDALNFKRHDEQNDVELGRMGEISKHWSRQNRERLEQNLDGPTTIHNGVLPLALQEVVL